MKYSCSECGKTKKENEFILIGEDYYRCVKCHEETASAFWGAGAELKSLKSRVIELEKALEVAEEEKRNRNEELSTVYRNYMLWRARAKLANKTIAKRENTIERLEQEKQDITMLLRAAIKGNGGVIPPQLKGEGEAKPFERALKPSRTKGFVYLIRSVHGLYKIGRSKNVQRRMDTFTVKLPFPIRLAHSFLCGDYIKAERFLHEKYDAKRLNGEWFELGLEDVEWIKSITHDSQLYEDGSQQGN